MEYGRNRNIRSIDLTIFMALNVLENYSNFIPLRIVKEINRNVVPIDCLLFMQLVLINNLFLNFVGIAVGHYFMNAWLQLFGTKHNRRVYQQQNISVS